METIREDGDARSPKRHALTSVLVPCNSAARAMAALDAAIWTSIVEFMLMPKEIDMVENTPSTVEDEHDYETELGYNAARTGQTTGTSQEPSYDQGEQDPQVVAMRGRYYERPPNYLEEDLVNWHKLGIFHRPSQYSFLTTLQQHPPVGTWPELEDPFSLFGDLVRLLMLPHGERLIAGGEASETMSKFIAAPTEADASSDYFRFYVMKTLGFVPHSWHWGSGASDAWKGFTDPDAFEVAISKQFKHKEDDDDDEEEEEKNDHDFDDADDFEFPMCNVGDAKYLYQQLHQHCKDWRAACCNSGFDGDTPVVYVGESKAAAHWWIGFASTRCWT